MKKLFLLLLCATFLSGCASLWPNVTPPPVITKQVYKKETPESFASPVWKHIVLLLPLEGKLGSTSQAFRDGFLEAYYADKKNHSSAPIITVINTKNDVDIVASYKTALAKGADFIVGPLTKSGVTTLNASNVITLPTLALNKITESNRHLGKLYHYSLAPEDEATQVAKQAYRSGKTYAVIIAEQSDWGKRTANAFAKKWEQLGGRVAETTYYVNDEKLDLVIKKAFRVIDVPKEKETGKNHSFTARKDVDMVFLASRVEEARQLRPFISYYYTDDLPVYSTASIYLDTDTSNATLDRDLNGIIFCDMPWVIDPASTSHTLRAELGEIWNQSSDLSRLYAMGADAYQITKRLGKTNKPFAYRGATGYLTLDTEQHINRELMCAKLKGGQLRIIH